MDKISKYQCTDPEVTRIKFNTELHEFERLNEFWHQKGIFMYKKNFPVAEFLFITANIEPKSIAFAIRVDFTNYDTEPLSIKVISPFTGEILKREQINVRFFKISEFPIPTLPIDLLQGPQGTIPFFCLPGIREYHDHPAHTGDSWFLYRMSNNGNLAYILDLLYSYSIPYFGYNITFNINQIQDFRQKKVI